MHGWGSPRAGTVRRRQDVSVKERENVDVMFLGLRSIEAQGGVEKHVLKLASWLNLNGWRVEIVERSPYVKVRGSELGLTRTTVWAPTHRALEAAVHTFLGLIRAGWTRPSIVHIHAVGPGLLVPFAKLLGLRVVFTHHGKDYDREKWGRLAKQVLQAGERFALKFSDQVICVSKSLTAELETRYRRQLHAIQNGIDPVVHRPAGETLATLGVSSRRYALCVGRLVEEKRQLDLVEAIGRNPELDEYLVIVGKEDHPSEYGARLIQAASRDRRVVLAGFRSGVQLEEIYSNADRFILPSSHEGLPIVLLEAISYGLSCLASDIPANREVALPDGCYFPVGDVDRIAELAFSPSTRSLSSERSLVAAPTWDAVAEETSLIYRKTMRNGRQ